MTNAANNNLGQNKSVYFVSTGPKQGFYTLRRAVYVPHRDHFGGFWAQYYIQNLSHTQEGAIEKAREITGQTLSIGFEISPNKEKNPAQAPDWYFCFGKYRGQSVEDVMEKDPGYVAWAAEGITSQKFQALRATCAAVAADYLKVQAELKAARKEAMAHKKAVSQWVGTVGARIEMSVRLEKQIELEPGQWGRRTLVIMVDEHLNSIKWFASGGLLDWNEGEVDIIKATVRKHSEYQGNKETIVNRVTFIG